METKFTKGNWIFSKYSPIDYGVHSESGNGNDIALVRGDSEEAEANAKLITSAPELLNALILANNIIERMSDEYSAIANKHANFTMGESRIIENAIRKATE
jgi:hypothetical protein